MYTLAKTLVRGFNLKRHSYKRYLVVLVLAGLAFGLFKKLYIPAPEISARDYERNSQSKSDNEKLANFETNAIKSATSDEIERRKYKFFEKNEFAASVLERSMRIFGELPFGQSASEWIAMGANMTSSPEYGRALKTSFDFVNRNPRMFLNFAQSKMNEIRQEPFIHQMTINLVAQLSLDDKEKAKFYLDDIGQPLVLDKDNQLAGASANLTLTLLFLNDLKLPRNQIQEQLSGILKRYPQNSAEFSAFYTRASQVFPGFKFSGGKKL